MMLSFPSFFVFSPPGKPFPVSQSGGRRAPATVMSNVWLPYCDSLWLCMSVMWQIRFPFPNFMSHFTVYSLQRQRLCSLEFRRHIPSMFAEWEIKRGEQQIVCRFWCISVGFPTGRNQCFYCQCIQHQRCLPFWAFSCVFWIRILKKSKHGGGGGKKEILQSVILLTKIWRILEGLSIIFQLTSLVNVVI